VCLENGTTNQNVLYIQIFYLNGAGTVCLLLSKTGEEERQTNV